MIVLLVAKLENILVGMANNVVNTILRYKK